MRKSALGAMLACLIGSAHADDAWRYRDIHLGAHMTKDQIMHALGSDKYANNPTFDPWNNAKGCDKNPTQKVCEDSDFNKYGLAATEYEAFQLGPYCEDEGPPNSFHCDNPLMSGLIPDWMAHGHGISEVWVSVRGGVVENIEVKFDSVNADEFFEVAHRQLDGDWKVEHEAMVISNRKNPKDAMQVDRIIETKKTKLYGATMTNYDEIFQHVTPPIYRGYLEMKILDQTL